MIDPIQAAECAGIAIIAIVSAILGETSMRSIDKSKTPTRRLPKIEFAGLCLLAAFFIFSIQQGCQTTGNPPSWIAGTIWFCLAIILTWLAIWFWDRSASRHWARKLMLSALALIMIGGLSYIPVAKQYRTEHRQQPQRAVPIAHPKTEAERERELLDQLRDRYIKQYPDKATTALVAGREDPPVDWLNGQLTAMGEKLRFSAAPNRPASPTEEPSIEGFHETPDHVTFSLGEGGMTAGYTLKWWRNKPLTPFHFGAYEPITAIIKGDKLLLSFKLWGGVGQPPIEMANNSFTVHTPPGWDRNSSINALEVVNAEGKPMFQMIRKTPTDIAMNGIFPLPDGQLIIAGPNGSVTTPPNPTRAASEFSLKPIFKYPSWKFPGQYADESRSDLRPWIYVTNARMEDQHNHHFFHLVVTNKGSRPAYNLAYEHGDEIGIVRLRNTASNEFEFDRKWSSSGKFFSHLDMLASGDTADLGYGPETIDITIDKLKPDAHQTIRRVGKLTYSDAPETTQPSPWGRDYGVLTFCFEMMRLTEQEQAALKRPSIVLNPCTERGTNISK